MCSDSTEGMNFSFETNFDLYSYADCYKSIPEKSRIKRGIGYFKVICLLKYLYTLKRAYTTNIDVENVTMPSYSSKFKCFTTVYIDSFTPSAYPSAYASVLVKGSPYIQPF